MRPAVLLLAASLTLGACALTRGPLTPAERLVRTQQRLDAAPTPDARRDVAEVLFTEARLSPVAGTRRAFGRVVAGIVPGRRPYFRDTLVIVAAALDGPHAATLVEAARAVAVEANTRGANPERSVMVALWPAGLTPEQGVAAVRAFPLWPPDAVHRTLVLADGLSPGVGTSESAVVALQSGGLPADMSVGDLTATVLSAAHERLDLPR